MFETIKVTMKLREKLSTIFGASALNGSEEQVRKLLVDAVKSGKLKAKEIIGLSRDKGNGKPAKGKKKVGSKGAALVAAATGSSGDVKVRSPFDRHDKSRGNLLAKAKGLGNVPAPSALEKAKAATWLKFTALKSGLPVNWTEHDEQMLAQMFKSDRWQRVKGRNDEEELSGEQARAMLSMRSVSMQPFSTKALLDDTTSGGLELAPILFDDLLTLFPVLNGELAPFVDMKDVERGRRIQSGSLGNPSVNYGPSEGAAITPFNTADLANPIDTNVFPITCAIEVGQDFLSDAGVDVGSALVEQVGQVFAGAIDNCIAAGDGVTQSLGLINTSGYLSVNSCNGASGPPTVDDLETLFFSVPKQYRRKENNLRFVMSDNRYHTFRAIPVGPTDERRVFGNWSASGSGAAGLSDYTLYGEGVSVNNNLLTNNYAMFCALKLYRMYRRLGATFTWHQEGEYLALRNLKLLVVRARYGGQYRIPAALAIMSDMAA